MKKLLSICLSVILVLGLIPSVFATTGTPADQVTVSTTGVTKVEAEDYPYTKGTIQATEGGAVTDATPSVEVKNDDPSASEGEYLYANISSTTAFDRTHYWEYKFVITQDGEYKIRTRVGKPWRYRSGALYVTFGDTTIASITGWNNTTTGEAVEWGVFEKDVTLTAGTYTFKVETDEGTGGNHQLFADYVSVEYVPEVIFTVPANGTKIQAEDLKVKRTVDTTLTPDIITDASADGGKYLDSQYGQISGCTTSVEAKLNVLTTGLYDINIKAQQLVNESGYKFSVDEGTEVTFSSGADATEWKIYKTSSFLTAGEHIVKLSSVGLYGHCRLIADYIELSPGGVVDVSSSVETVIEAEDYAYTYTDINGTTSFYTGTVKNDVATASGGEYLFNNAGGSTEGAEHYWEVTLNIAQTGVYDITSTVPTLAKYRFYSVKIMLDENELYSESSTNPSYNSDIPEFSNKTARQYLSAGSHKYRFYVGKGTGGNQQLYLDAVKIKPVVTGTADPDATSVVFGFATEIFADTEASVTYTYSGTNAEGNSILRLMYKDGDVWKEGAKQTVSGGTGSIILADSLVGKEVCVEFIPVDNTGTMGPLFSQNIGTLRRAIYINPSFTKNTTSSQYEASVGIEFNSATMALPQILIVVAQYDAAGAMVGYTPLYVNDMSRNYNSTKTLNVPFAQGATSATLFIWDGTSIDTVTAKAYTDSISQ